jgi:O-antigen/teichoic acid export membrane protein
MSLRSRPKRSRRDRFGRLPSIALGSDEQSLSMGAGALAGTSGSAAFAAFEFLLVVILTRGLGAAGSGVFFTVMSLFMLTMGLLMIGPTQGVIRSVAHAVALDQRRDVRHLTMLAVVPTTAVAAAIGLGAVLAAPLLSDLVFGDGRAVSYLRTMAPALPFAVAMHLLLATSRGMGTMKPTVLFDRVGVGAARPLLVAAVLLSGGGAAWVGAAWALPYALAAVVSAVWVVRAVHDLHDEGQAEASPVRGLARTLWSFSAVRGLASGMELTTRWIDIPLVAALASPEAAGVYAAATRLTLAGGIALRGVALSFTPQISSLIAKGDREGAHRSFHLATCWTIAASLPIYLALVAYPETILDAFGEGFSAGDTALVILACGKLVGLLFGPITIVLLMEGKTWLNAMNATIGTLINVGLNLLLIPALGIEGAAIAWVASILFLNVAPTIQLYRSDGYQPLSDAWLVLVGQIAATIGVLGVLVPLALGLSEPVGLACLLLLGGPAYLIALYRSRRVTGIDILLRSVRQRSAEPGPAT